MQPETMKRSLPLMLELIGNLDKTRQLLYVDYNSGFVQLDLIKTV